MPTGDDLVGLGVPSELARAIGNTYQSLACAGTTLSTATSVKSHNVELIASSSNTGAVLQATAKVGSPHFFFCSSSTAGVVYVPSGDAMNGVTNAPLTLTQNKAAIVMKYKQVGSVGSWSGVLTA